MANVPLMIQHRQNFSSNAVTEIKITKVCREIATSDQKSFPYYDLTSFRDLFVPQCISVSTLEISQTLDNSNWKMKKIVKEQHSKGMNKD